MKPNVELKVQLPKTKSCCAVCRNGANSVMHSPCQRNRQRLDYADMALIPAGSFLTGSDDEESSAEDGERDRREVELEAYYIDKYAVTNEQFAVFVEQTGYQTDAERYGWSFVFHLLLGEETAKDQMGILEHTPWWVGVKGADWQHPEGRGSSIQGRSRHPVVHVSWNDANAYADWAGKRLLTEAEWENAAASGVWNRKYPWGEELHQEAKHHCNIWQGEFPHSNTLDDGYLTTAPVDSYEPNEYGLYNMAGNVWEWTADVFASLPAQGINGHDLAVKVIKGGSYLCHASYCNRYRLSARTFNTVDSSTGHMGFRCAASL